MKNIIIIVTILGLSIVNHSDCKKSAADKQAALDAKKTALIKESQLRISLLAQQIIELQGDATRAVKFAQKAGPAANASAIKAMASPKKSIVVDDPDYETASENASCALAYAMSTEQSLPFVAASVDDAIKKQKQLLKQFKVQKK